MDKSKPQGTCRLTILFWYAMLLFQFLKLKYQVIPQKGYGMSLQVVFSTGCLYPIFKFCCRRFRAEFVVLYELRMRHDELKRTRTGYQPLKGP